MSDRKSLHSNRGPEIVEITEEDEVELRSVTKPDIKSVHTHKRPVKKNVKFATPPASSSKAGSKADNGVDSVQKSNVKVGKKHNSDLKTDESKNKRVFTDKKDDGDKDLNLEDLNKKVSKLESVLNQYYRTTGISDLKQDNAMLNERVTSLQESINRAYIHGLVTLFIFLAFICCVFYFLYNIDFFKHILRQHYMRKHGFTVSLF